MLHRLMYWTSCICLLSSQTSFALNLFKLSLPCSKLIPKPSLSNEAVKLAWFRSLFKSFHPLNAFANGLKSYDSDKESNRKFRRTVFNKHDWKKHRSGNRYFTELLSMPRSVVLRGLVMQAFTVTAFSAFIVAYNLLIETRILPKFFLLSSPPLPFNLTSSALGLLLVFRTNAAYSRWKDARIAWAIISAKSFDVMRQAIGWIDEDVVGSVGSPTTKEQRLEKANIIKSKICRYIVTYAKCLKWHLGHVGNDRRLMEDLSGILDPKEVKNVMGSRHRPQYVLSQIIVFLKASGLAPNIQTHIDRSICDISVSMTTCERIFTSPIPLMYTRHTARFLFLWLLGMPMCLYHEYPLAQKWMVPFISFGQALFLFGIEELGVQIEEPFSILPLANVCSDIHRTAEDLLSESGIPWFGCTDECSVTIEDEKEKIKATIPSHPETNLPEQLYATQGYFNTTSLPLQIPVTVAGEILFRIPVD